MQIDLGNIVLISALTISGVAALIWYLGNPKGRPQRWAERAGAEIAEAKRMARHRREAEARGDEEMQRIRAIADRELERLNFLSRRDK